METGKALYEDAKSRNYSAEFFEALSLLGQTLSKITETLLNTLKVAPIFGLADSMASLEGKIQVAPKSYSDSGISEKDKQETIDDVVTDGMGFIGAIVQTA